MLLWWAAMKTFTYVIIHLFFTYMSQLLFAQFKIQFSPKGNHEWIKPNYILKWDPVITWKFFFSHNKQKRSELVSRLPVQSLCKQVTSSKAFISSCSNRAALWPPDQSLIVLGTENVCNGVNGIRAEVSSKWNYSK